MKSVVILLLAAHSLPGCTITVESVRHARKHAEMVFRGTILEIGEDEVIFDVQRVWKGRVPARFSMAKVFAYDSCISGFRREQVRLGAELLVYARRIPELKVDGYVAEDGQHTGLIEHMADDLRKLGKGSPPARDVIRHMSQ